MSLLLDTHVLLWWLMRVAFAAPAQAAIADPGNEVVVSAVSAWEISIKKSRGKLDAPDDLHEQIEMKRFAALPITISHALAVGALPRHHNDPFDRMLIAQALVEGLTIVTRDRWFASYGVPILRA